jgi:hypothetical protein
VNRRRALVVAALSLVTLVIHLVLVRAMAHGHVAHVLLGSGNAVPPLGAAFLAIALVLVRLAAVVVAPGLLLASLASLVAHVLVGPPRDGGDHREGGGAGAGEEGSGTTSGAGKRSGEESSGGAMVADGTGISMEGRGT